MFSSRQLSFFRLYNLQTMLSWQALHDALSALLNAVEICHCSLPQITDPVGQEPQVEARDFCPPGSVAWHNMDHKNVSFDVLAAAFS